MNSHLHRQVKHALGKFHLMIFPGPKGRKLNYPASMLIRVVLAVNHFIFLASFSEKDIR
jgi:hypothetical protein